MKDIIKDYDDYYNQNMVVNQNDFVFGWMAFLFVIVSLLITPMVGIWRNDFPVLWESIWVFFRVIFAPAIVILIFIRLFPSSNARLVYKVKEINVLEVLFQSAICIIAGIGNFFVISIIFGQSVFVYDIELFLFVLCNATWEELFFCGIQIGTMRFLDIKYAKYYGIGIRALVFSIYHICVYGNIPMAMLSMLLMGLIYGIALQIGKRVDVCIVTHVVLNLLAG